MDIFKTYGIYPMDWYQIFQTNQFSAHLFFNNGKTLVYNTGNKSPCFKVSQIRVYGL